MFTQFVLEIIITILIGFFGFLLLYELAKKFLLVDKPNYRKVHKNLVPLIGGPGISLIFLVSLFINDYPIFEKKLIFCSVLICLVGLIDDKFDVNPALKLLFQFLISLFFILDNNLYLERLNFGFFILNFGIFSKLITVASILFLINSLNYLDGLDGQVGLISVQIIFCIFFLNNEILNIYFLSVLICSLILFLFFNFNFIKRRIFLGDSGSNMLGFIISILIIDHHNKNIINIENSLVYGWLLGLIIFEFLSTNIFRILKKKNILVPGNDHLHYFLLKYFGSHIKVSLIVMLTSLTFFYIGFNITKYSDVLSFVLFLLFFLNFYFIRSRLSKFKK